MKQDKAAEAVQETAAQELDSGEVFLSDPEWRAFVEKADAEWAEADAQEQEIRETVLPTKKLPFTVPPEFRDIEVDINVPMQTKDGTTLMADVYRPSTAGRYPVVMMRTPYDKLGSLDYGPAVMRNLAQRGYVGVIQDVRGKYASSGNFEPRINEECDGYDAVEWAAGQPWSNGKVGMWGISYGGLSALAAAISKAPSLVCIYPGMIDFAFSSRETGIISLQGRAGWLIFTTGKETKNPLRIDFNHLPLKEIDEKAGFPNPLYDALVTMDHDKYSAHEIPERLKRLESLSAATYMVAGWYDELLKGTISTWQRIHQNNPNTKIMIGPWHHNVLSMEEPRIGKIPTDDVESRRYYEQMELFFDLHLKQEDNPLAHQEAPIKLFVMGTNQWRHEYEWPLARTQFTKYYIGDDASNSGGVLKPTGPRKTEPADRFDYDPQNPVAWPASADVWQYLDGMGSCAETERRDDVLIYSSPFLDSDTEVTGPVSMTLYAASSAEDTDFVATLIDVHPDGHSQYITSGIVRARYRNGTDVEAFINPGEVYQYTIEMAPTSNVFRKGHRIRLAISSSDFSRFARSQNTSAPIGMTKETVVAIQSIFHDDTYMSHLMLPIIR